MRIFDRVASGETVRLQDGAAPTDLQTRCRKAAHSYQRIIADEAAQFVYQSNNQDMSVANGDFGALNPPFDRMWIEWQTPSFRHFGNKWHRMSRSRVAAKVVKAGNDLDIELLMAHDQSQAIGVTPIGVEILNCSDLPGLSVRVTAHEHIRYLRDERLPDATPDQYAQGLFLETWPIYMAIGWMNCRNVTLETVAAPSRLAKKRQRRGLVRGLDYKKILLDAGTTSSLAKNSIASAHDPKRLHIVRGHIRHYSAERPAFGTYVGNMWIHQHMRGDKALGSISHEYHVQPRGSR